MTRLVLLLACALCLASGLAVATPALGAPPLPPGYHSCGAVSGPTISQPWRTDGAVKIVPMHHFRVGATTDVACAFSRTWVVRIVHESTPSGLLPHPNGPATWRCTAGDLVRHVAVSGFCHDSANEKGFSWGAVP